MAERIQRVPRGQWPLAERRRIFELTLRGCVVRRLDSERHIVYDPNFIAPLNNRRWPSMRIGAQMAARGPPTRGRAFLGTVVGALASAVPAVRAEADARELQLPRRLSYPLASVWVERRS